MGCRRRCIPVPSSSTRKKAGCDFRRRERRGAAPFRFWTVCWVGDAMTDSIQAAPVREALETMVAEADTGGRKPTGFSKRYIFTISLAWALFQLWYASPLPYKLHFGVINDGQARIIHLTFAFLLAFATFPALKSSPRNRIPITDWILAALGVAAAMYLLAFYNEISLRPGLPTLTDVVISTIGVVLLLEAARRAVGPALAIIAALMLF